MEASYVSLCGQNISDRRRSSSTEQQLCTCTHRWRKTTSDTQLHSCSTYCIYSYCIWAMESFFELRFRVVRVSFLQNVSV